VAAGDSKVVALTSNWEVWWWAGGADSQYTSTGRLGLMFGLENLSETTTSDGIKILLSYCLVLQICCE
jgi:hypothetical protein